MINPPKVTIGTRTFEREHLLGRAIDSAIAQTFTDWEMIVVNNGGDSSAVDDVIAQRADHHRGRVRAIHLETPVSIGDAATIALDAGSGEFVILLDDDDSIDAEFLAKMIAELDAAPMDVGGVACRVRRVFERVSKDGSVETVSVEEFNPNLEHVSFQSAFSSHPVSTNSFLVRRSTYESAGKYDDSPSTGEDAYLLLRILAQNRVQVLPQTLAARHERVEDALGGTNLVADGLLIRDGDAVYRDRILESKLRAGSIAPARVAAAISVTDRENFLRIDEALNHLREMRVHVGDFEQRASVSQQQLDPMDGSFRVLRTLISPVIFARRLSARVARRGAPR